MALAGTPEQQWRLEARHPGMIGQLQRQSGRSEARLRTDHPLPEALVQAFARRPGRNLSSSFLERKERCCELGLESDPGETQQVPQSSRRNPADAAGTSRPWGAWGPSPDPSPSLPAFSLVVSTAQSRLTSYCTWKPFCDLRTFEKRTKQLEKHRVVKKCL